MNASTPVERNTCRNCGAPIDGRYCASCGQETRLALPTAREFLREAAGRYVAIDGRLWRSLFALLTRPGYLTREYFEGRRRRYIRPARLFLVLSLALFAALRFTGEVPMVIASDPGAVDEPRQKSARPSNPGVVVKSDDDIDFKLDEVEQWSPVIAKRLQRFRDLPKQEKAEQLTAGALRYGPYAMLALLPAFALLLQIVYVGRRKRYPQRPRRYAQHLVFAAHNHGFLCLIALMAAVVPISALRPLFACWALAYFAWSMRAVYGGRWSGVFARGFVVAVVYFVLFAIAVAMLILAAALLR